MQNPLPSPAPTERPLKVFYCYARKDERLRNELDKHLEALKHSGQISVWYDRKIKAGMNWQEEIDWHLDTADIVLLLISPNFMNSQYCYGKEMQRALERSKQKKAIVIPIILRPTDWKETPIGLLQALPSNGKPLTTWHSQDMAFLDVIQGIRNALPSIEKSDVIGDQIDFPFSESIVSPIELIENLDPSFPTVLIIDTSDTMRGEPIEALNKGLQAFQENASELKLLAHRMEVALVTFGYGKAQVAQSFITVKDFHPPTLLAGGTRPMGEAIQQTLDILKDRKDQYNRQGRLYWRPWVFLITSSEPSDDWQTAFEHILQEENEGALRFFVVGLGNAQFLSRIATRKAVQLKKLKFIEMFRWIVTARGQIMRSNRFPGEFALPPIDTWAD